MKRTPANRQHDQKGAALLALLTLVLLAGVYLFLDGANNLHATALTRSARTTAVLNQAKEALIARSVVDTNRPGSLPCPDSDGDGIAEILPGGNCKDNLYVGWLPWRTLDLDDPRDEAGARLWYAVSRSLRDHQNAEPINSDTATDLTLDGTPDIAAIVFAAGSVLPGKTRPSNNPADYLDAGNGDGDNAYVNQVTGVPFNDQVVALRRNELMQAVERRVAKTALDSLDAYRAGHGVYPYPAAPGCISGVCASESGLCRGRFPEVALLGPPHNLPDWSPPLPGWFMNNRWAQTLYYAVARNRLESPKPSSSQCSGDANVAGNDRDLVLITPGAPAPATIRPSTLLSAYLDDAANQDGWSGSLPAADAYVLPSATANDRLYSR